MGKSGGGGSRRPSASVRERATRSGATPSRAQLAKLSLPELHRAYSQAHQTFNDRLAEVYQHEIARRAFPNAEVVPFGSNTSRSAVATVASGLAAAKSPTAATKAAQTRADNVRASNRRIAADLLRQQVERQSDKAAHDEAQARAERKTPANSHEVQRAKHVGLAHKTAGDVQTAHAQVALIHAKMRDQESYLEHTAARPGHKVSTDAQRSRQDARARLKELRPQLAEAKANLKRTQAEQTQTRAASPSAHAKDEVKLPNGTYVSRAEHEAMKQRAAYGGPVYRALLKNGSVEARSSEGTRFRIVQHANAFGLPSYDIIRQGETEPADGYKGIIINRERLLDMTHGLTVARASRAKKASA